MTPSPWRVTLGRRVRQQRVGRGWSVRQVSAKSGIAATTWQRIETGASVSDWVLVDAANCLGWPQGEAFRIIADALDTAEQRGR